MAVTPTMQDEVAFISNVNANGTLAQKSFYSWNQNTPASYSTTWTTARKWGGTAAGTSGGTIAYDFDPGSKWSATEQKWLTAGLALWAAVANVKFVQTTNSAQAKITFHRTTNGGSYTYAFYNPALNACVSGGKVLGTITNSSINIDPNGTTFGPINGLASQGGFTIENLIHEEGHALGLGHAGPYNGAVNTFTQQYSAYDTKLYSVMSYINPNTASKYGSQSPVAGVDWGGGQPTTWMPLDILAIQRIYGVAATTPLDGGEVFGFHTNIKGALQPFFDFTQNKKPIITIWDKGTGNALDLSGFSGTASVNLNPGTYSSAAGLTKNIAIAYGTQINKLVCTAGGSTVTCNNDGDTVIGGMGADTIRSGSGNDSLSGGNGNDIFYASTGNDTINGGAGTDTIVFAGKAGAYKIEKNAAGQISVTGTGTKDILASVEVLKFADKSITSSGLLAGTLNDTGITTASTTPIGWSPITAPTSSTALNALPAGATDRDVLADLRPAAPLTNSTPLLSTRLIDSAPVWHAAVAS